ncbi:uncharacterized protein LOC127944604 [Carassius gibelio]|uniref:uncharacterized protein LOC127944377 n=1 Tax=Carassius gibelio TaxID=101364 RepID=UPI0022786247|nr:uncharacterized protein LOC127944377 [Carassius gibelio]XP_052396616.1 uncharacterized protein LOC127944604 [Carassius gibelio]
MIFLLLVVQGLMFILTGGERVSEGKICSKKIFERSKLKADDHLMVVRCGTNELVAQFNCINWNCSDDPDTEGWFNRTGDLVLNLLNCSSLDRYNATLNLQPILQNFTLDEEPVLSSTKASPQTSSPKPPDSSGHLWLWLCVLLILPVLTVIGFLLLKKHWRDREALPDAEKARETPAVSSTASAQNNWGKNCTVCSCLLQDL